MMVKDIPAVVVAPEIAVITPSVILVRVVMFLVAVNAVVAGIPCVPPLPPIAVPNREIHSLIEVFKDAISLAAAAARVREV